MKKVYLVSSGSYDDYHVVGICSTYKKAKRMMDIYNVENHMEIITIDDMPDIPAGYQFWRIDAFLQKNNIDICRWEFDKDLEEKITFFNFNHSPKITMYCFAKNKTHAEKIFSKKKADLILSGEWDKLCLGKM